MIFPRNYLIREPNPQLSRTPLRPPNTLITHFRDQILLPRRIQHPTLPPQDPTPRTRRIPQERYRILPIHSYLPTHIHPHRHTDLGPRRCHRCFPSWPRARYWCAGGSSDGSDSPHLRRGRDAVATKGCVVDEVVDCTLVALFVPFAVALGARCDELLFVL